MPVTSSHNYWQYSGLGMREVKKEEKLKGFPFL